MKFTNNIETATKYKLSDMQQGMLYQSLKSEMNCVYIVQKYIRFNESLNYDKLIEAWNRVITNNELLRSYFSGDGDYLNNQLIAKHCLITCKVNDWTDTCISQDQYHSKLELFLNKDVQIPFDLSNPPLMRINLIKCKDDLHYMVWTYHHTLFGGPSSIVVLKEVFAIYEALLSGALLPEFEHQSHQNVVSKIQEYQDSHKQSAKQYWQNTLADFDSPTPLPDSIDSVSLSKAPIRQGRFDISLLEASLQSLKQAAQQQRLTLSTYFYTAWGLLLGTYNNINDVVFGAVRAYPSDLIKNDIGLFINTLPLRLRINKQTVGDLLHEVRAQYKKFREYITTPFSDIQKLVDLPANVPLFNTIVNFRSHSLNETIASQSKNWNNRYLTQRFDIDAPLSLEIHAEDSHLNIEVNYDQKLFSEKFLSRFMNHYVNLLNILACEPELSLSRLTLLTPIEKKQLMLEQNSSHQEFPSQKSIKELFENTVEKHPNKPAIVFQSKQLTYAEFNERVNQLAHYIRAKIDGIKTRTSSDVLVSLCLERDLDMPIAIFATIKAGAAYVPVEPDLPDERLQYILKDSNPHVIITKGKILEQRRILKSFNPICLDAEETQLAIQKESISNPAFYLSADSLAYIIYTSGSTGKPKGACLRHYSVINRILWMQQKYDIGPEDIILQKTPYGFDVSVWEFFLPLFSGAQLVIAEPLGHRDPEYLIETINKNKITTLHFVPSMLNVFLKVVESQSNSITRLSSLKKIFSSGEALSSKLARQCNSMLSSELHNLYGPTEACVDVSYYQYDPDNIPFVTKTVPIGKPIDNTTLLVLDEHKNLLPIGVPGELYIGGCGLARDYLNRKKLTYTTFVENPHKEIQPSPLEERLYKTGDVVRRLPDGNIEYIGRTDSQLKIRGLRIELGEIESVLRHHKQVGDCVVLPVKKDDQIRLVAYCTPENVSKDEQAEENHSVLNNWETVFDKIYEANATSQESKVFDISGWNSSFTGNPIEAEVMQEWVDTIISRLKGYSPKHILEIGCGTGLLAFRWAPICSSYMGTDISNEAVESVAKTAKELGLKNLIVKQSAADSLQQIYLKELTSSAPDTIVLNSIIQYFPTVNYLEDVLNQAIGLIENKGQIFIGDVRDLRLQNTFYSAVEYFKNNTQGKPNNAKDIMAKSQAKRAREYELLIAPEFFIYLGENDPDCLKVELLPKRGTHESEMHTYRYDVILHIEKSKILHEQESDCRWITWSDDFELEQALRLGKDLVAIQGYPNQRVWGNYFLNESLPNPSEQSVEEIFRQHKVLSDMILSIEELNTLANKLGYKFHCFLSTKGIHAAACIDIVFSKVKVKINAYKLKLETEQKHLCYANDPMGNLFLSKLDVQAIKQYMKKFLPDYMQPNQYLLMKTFPLTKNGKIDKKRLPSPNVDTEARKERFVEAVSKEQQTLCNIWETVLRIEKVGINDNFFELGGDSIMLIEVYSKARETGINVTPKDVFAHPTIKELAACTGEEHRIIISDQGLAEGSVELTPIQEWFFSLNHSEKNHYNQAHLLKLKQAITSDHLAQIIRKIIKHHDTFRLRFKKIPQGVVEQYYDKQDSSFTPTIKFIDLSEIANDKQDEEIKKWCEDWQHLLDIKKGPVFSVGYFNNHHDGFDRIVLVAHHLVIDGVSWRILFDDFQRIHKQLVSQSEVTLPEKTSSFQLCSQALQQYRKSDAFQEQQNYWAHLVKQFSDDGLGSNHHSPIRQREMIPIELSKKQTGLLLSLSKINSFQINDILLSALYVAHTKWTNNTQLFLDLELHGRETCLDTIDSSRTIGWFTSLFPVLLELSEKECNLDADEIDYITCIQSIKKQCEALPDGGIGYGLLKYSENNKKYQQDYPTPAIMFNYFGQMEASIARNGLFMQSRNVFSNTVSTQNIFPHLIEINMLVHQGKLQGKILYNQDKLTVGEIASFTKHFKNCLEQLIKSVLNNINVSEEPEFNDINIQTDKKSKYDPILVYNNKGTNIPLIFIHPIAAGAEIYNGLAKQMSPEQPFYAIDYHNLHSNAAPIENMEDLATLYIDYVRMKLPHGPYCFGGWSYGAVVAYEASQQLRAQGEIVPNIFLIDQMPLRFARNLEEKNQLEAHTLENIDSISNEYFRDNFLPVELRGIFMKLPDSYKRHFIKTHRISALTVKNYIALPYAEKITLFKAKESLNYPYLNDEVFMQRFLSQFCSYDIEGDHVSIMSYESNVQAVISSIEAEIKNISKKI